MAALPLIVVSFALSNDRLKNLTKDSVSYEVFLCLFLNSQAVCVVVVVVAAAASLLRANRKDPRWESQWETIFAGTNWSIE